MAPLAEAGITLLETTPKTELVAKVRRALSRALAGDSKLNQDILSIKGMSGRKYRMFINNLVEEMESVRYLEVGSWAGSTLCSALFGNKIEAIAIDNWSQFGGPATEFFMNLARFKSDSKISFLEKDFRQVPYSALDKSNIYLFDGPHEIKDQRDGIVLAQPALDNCYVQIVDDWNWPFVRAGTMDAINEINLTIEFMAEIRTTLDDTHPAIWGPESDWHNGYCLAVLSKGS
jgi:hypothetical protein